LNRWTSWLVNAIELGLTYWVNLYVEPRLTDFLNPLPLVAPPLITLVLSGLIVVIVVDTTVARPKLVFRWADPRSRIESDPVIEVPAPPGKTVDVQVEFIGRSLLAKGIRKAFREPGVSVRVALGSSDAFRWRAEMRTSRAVVVDPEGQAVTMPFPRQGTAWVTLTAEMTEQALHHLEVEVQHTIDTSGYRSLLGRLVAKEHNVTKLRAIRTA
jgi:hypothetical protein